ncbi:hypothetical protein C7I84_24350 [Mesorhizobium ephedrae]|uniref:Uncharacterized protein n=2 Tax=Kumtagia ephedrae TaxID=2116701 RepID=A0A2P7RVR1_9HYPH|nr:hypothetical protein C7I84_24350 [Mesorhizobium ephedrae]
MFFKKLKKNLERNSFVRNRIVHSRCVGIWEKDPEYVLFAAFERFSDGHLAFDAIPLEEMARVTKWAEQLTALALRLSEQIGPTSPDAEEI